MLRNVSLVISLAFGLACSDAINTSDSSDIAVSETDVSRISCTLGGCGDGRICVQDNGPSASCVQPIGTCVLDTPLCPETSDYSDGWAACACGTTEYPSACKAREAGELSRLYLCKAEFQGAICDPTSLAPTCPPQSACILLAGRDGNQGRCMPISDACASAPPESACLSNLGPSLDSIAECYSSPCAAWQQGYRGPIAFSP